MSKYLRLDEKLQTPCPTDTLFDKYSDRIWKTPGSYYGHDPKGEVVLLTRNRDSGLIDNHNFETAKARIMGVCENLKLPDNNEFTYDWEARHFLHGWVQYLMVSPSAPEEVKSCAVEILEEIQDYTVLDMDDYQERLWECAEDTYHYLDDDDKLEMQRSMVKHHPKASEDEIISLCIELVAQEYVKE